MATMESMPDDVREFIQGYAWHEPEYTPWATLRTPIGQARIGLVVTACMTLPDQPPFEAEKPRNDASLRIIPAHTDPRALVNTFPGQAFDHAGLEEDANLLIPIDRLHEMARAGQIGELAPRVASLCGHIVDPRELIDTTAPEIASMFLEDDVDAVVLVPA